MCSWKYSEAVPAALLSQEDARQGIETNRDFRQQAEILRAHLLEAARGKTGRCLVIGAGSCEDVPLAQLAAQFNEVHLLDIRPLNPPIDSEYLKLHQEDISNCISKLLRQLNQLPHAADPHRRSALVAETLDRFHISVTNAWEGLGKFDFIASTLVLSQLGRPIQTYLHQQAIHQSALLQQSYRDFLTTLQRAHLHWMAYHASPTASFFLSTTPILEVNGDHLPLVDESILQELEQRFAVKARQQLEGWHSSERYFQPVTFSFEQQH